MQKWLKISLSLCCFGFLKEIRPSEPFVTDFLIGPWRNVTEAEINREVYPMGTYSYTTQLIIAFLITDLLRYKPLIIVSGLSGIIVWSMLLWTSSLKSLKILEIFYGTYMATEVAYFAYIYAKVDKDHYNQVTSHTRAALFCGRFMAGLLGQVLIYFEVMNYRELNYITFGTQIIATIWALFLPNVQTSVYFHRNVEQKKLVILNSLNDDIEQNEENEKNVIDGETSLNILWTQFRQAYSNKKVLRWSLWYALGMGGYLQVISYIQILWSSMNNGEQIILNGAIEAIITSLSAAIAILAGYLHNGIFNNRRSLVVLMLLSFLEGTIICLTTELFHLYLAYLSYVFFGVLYSFGITVASAEIAKHLDEDSFGLVFGFNTFIALLIQTILTVLFVSGNIFILNVYQQFFIYGLYYLALGFVYLAVIIWDIYRNRKDLST